MDRLVLSAVVLVPLVVLMADARPGSAETAAEPASAPAALPAPPMTPTAAGCLNELTTLGVPYRKATRKGITIAVEVTGPIAGVTFALGDTLVLDCSLVVSLALAAPYFSALGFDHANVASGHSRRNVRGTSRPSKHSYGLAVDISWLRGPTIGTLRLDRDYEQGLGDGVDCIGEPVTEGGATLKIAQCQLTTSGLFYLVLSPDYDDAHHDHFHLETRPWADRDALRAARPAIH